jgi:hypothetical protein
LGIAAKSISEKDIENMSESAGKILPHLIGGQKYIGSDATQLVNINPGTGEEISSVPMDDVG